MTSLASDHSEISDDRVVQGMASLLGRNILVITGNSSENAHSKMYRPFCHPKSSVQSTLTLGHIEDHHFVPLRRTSECSVNLILIVLNMNIFFKIYTDKL